MDGSESASVDSVATEQGEASIMDVLPAFERLLEAYKLRFSDGKSLIAADYRLSIKAIILCALTALLMVSVTTVLWISINVVIAVALFNLNFHWLGIFLLIAGLNGGLLYWLMQIYKGGLKAISFKSSYSALLVGEPPTDKQVNK